jgi:hypothetical protein
MTPEHKAKAIIDALYLEIQDATAGMFEENQPYDEARKKAAKSCAIICCDEIIEDFHGINDKWNQDAEARIAYWQLVKQHIQSL